MSRTDDNPALRISDDALTEREYHERMQRENGMGETYENEAVPAAEDPAVGVPMHGLSATPQVKASDLTNRLATIREAMTDAMHKDVDYGVVPGTDKPTLLKPGSEKLGVLFQLDIQLQNEKLWGPDDHLTVISSATAYHAPTGTRLGYGEGMCSTREKKYAYRKEDRKCPQCGAAAIIKGKAEYGGGWLCWKKRGGCGAKFNDGAAEIENQAAGDVDNPDIPDCWNTVIKMAEKRARVDCVLAVTGASALFTQDVEDMPPQGPPEPQTPPKPETPPEPDPIPQETVDQLEIKAGEGTEAFRSYWQSLEKGTRTLVSQHPAFLGSLKEIAAKADAEGEQE